VNCIAFPDDGATKRFGALFEEYFPDWPIVTCGKVCCYTPHPEP
jgi:hypothetical protein